MRMKLFVAPVIYRYLPGDVSLENPMIFISIYLCALELDKHASRVAFWQTESAS